MGIKYLTGIGRCFGYTKDAGWLFFHKGNGMPAQIVKPAYLF
jgi:hypothetical protein